MAITPSIKILVIDDNEDDREMYARALRKSLGHDIQIVEVELGHQGLEKLSNGCFDVVLLDYHLPDSNGLQFLEALKKQEQLVPIVMITGQDDHEVAARSIQLGAQDYLSKDHVTAESLLHAITNAIEKVNLHKSLAQHQDERERLVKELAETNEYLKNFSHTVAHDLKGPLCTIETYIHGWDVFYTQMGKEQLLDRMGSCAKKMRTFINSLLEFAINTKKAESVEEVDLNVVVEEVLTSLAVNTKEKRAVIQFKKLPTMVGNKVQLYQVFLNLLNNSLKFSKAHESPCIKISSQALEKRGSMASPHEQDMREWVQISFCDNGIGMEQSQCEKIFIPFHRLWNKSEYEGSGIGLATVKKIIDLHGGQICAQSEKNLGTTFLMTLPLKPVTVLDEPKNRS